MTVDIPKPRRDLSTVALPQSFKFRLRLAYTAKSEFAKALRTRRQGVRRAIELGLTIADAYHLGFELHELGLCRELLKFCCLSSLRRLYGLTPERLLELIPELELEDVGKLGASAAELVQFGFTHKSLLDLDRACGSTADKLCYLGVGAAGWYVLGLRKHDLLKSNFRRHHCTSTGWDYGQVISVYGLTTEEQRSIGIQLLFTK